jgi:hypothetical protein
MFLIGIEFVGPSMETCSGTSYKIKYQIENEFMSQYWKTPAQSASITNTPTDYEVELPHPYKIDAHYPYKLNVWVEVSYRNIL